MVQRYSSRRQQLDQQFIQNKLQGAVRYDRIAGYFRSSMLEVAGEALEQVEGKVRVICNSDIEVRDVEVSRAAAQHAMRRSWCASDPEKLGDLSKKRFARLYELLATEKLEVRVLPDEVFGLIHGKAGVIHYGSGAATSFLGSVNESLTAWKLNYELRWEDDDLDSVNWVQEEFDALWSHPLATPLSEFVIEDIRRIAKRKKIDLTKWKADPDPAAGIVETPVYRKEFGLWAHQKYFVKKAFDAHRRNGARFLLADQVGLGKTIQLALAAMLMALEGDKPVLVLCPKPLMVQWQDELRDLLGMPTAYWDGKRWIDEQGIQYPVGGDAFFKRCPRKVGIVSQGLVTAGSSIIIQLLNLEYECVIVDEAHRARRRNLNENSQHENADPNNLMAFLLDISQRTKSMLLATATPVQLYPIEAWDLLSILAVGSEGVFGRDWSQWYKPDQALPVVMGEREIPSEIGEAWQWMRNPFPEEDEGREFKNVRRSLGMSFNDEIAPAEAIDQLRQTTVSRLRTLALTFGQDHNPFIRRIIRRTRGYLESQINEETGEPFLKKVEIKLFGEGDDEAIILPPYLTDAYQSAERFCNLLSSRVRGAGFFKTLLLRRIGSTIHAGQNTIEKMLEDWNIATSEAMDSSEEDDEEERISHQTRTEMKDLTAEETQELRRCLQALEANRDRDPKYHKVVQLLLDEKWIDRGCIVFSQYFDSIWWLAEQLSFDVLKDEVIGIYAGGARSGFMKEGRFTRVQRDEIKAMVQRGEVRLLLGTEAASEGLNLQRLGTLINLDLPWNPTRLEQRKGRIQRIGQERDTVFVYNMRYKDSVEDRVHQLLSSRLEGIHSMFGQIPDILKDAWIDVALGEVEDAKKLIASVHPAHPFDNRYSQVEMIDWESCSTVLDSESVVDTLRMGWNRG